MDTDKGSRKNRNVIDSKWVFKTKDYANGTVDR